MILHLLSESVIDSLIIKQMEECYPGENSFLLFAGRTALDSFDPDFRDRITVEADKESIDFRNINGIIIHYLSFTKIEYLKNIPGNIPVACSIWGGDFYNFLPKFHLKLYGRITKKFVNNNRKGPWLYYILKYRINFPLSENYKLWKKSLQSIMIYSTVIPYEKNLVEKYFHLNAQYLPLPTHSIDKVLNTDDFENSISTKENFKMNILIGNSGNPTNNHLEILNYLKKFKSENISVQLPLTYGNQGYIDHICKTGNTLLGEKFIPLLNHLDNAHYFNFINCFNIFIFNSYRQQGIGTIVLAIWTGGKVYLSNKNITGSYYKDNGIKLFSIEDDLFTSESSEIFKPLSKEEILANRRALMNLYSNSVVNISIRNFVENLKGAQIVN
jgi:dTDP-N-acetylfucosamine:lipid II N-acetylfucosaminyltransferase